MRHTFTILTALFSIFFTPLLSQNSLKATEYVEYVQSKSIKPKHFTPIDSLKPQSSEQELKLLIGDKLAPQKPNNKRAGLILGGSTLVSFGGAFAYLKQVWWQEEIQKFHFDWGRDYRYANNLDKMGHFMGGLIIANIYSDGFKAMHFSDKKAALLGFAAGAGVQLAIEVKDGYSPHWGYSIGDLVGGSIGALQPYLQLKSAFFRNTDFKFSYYQHSTRYFDTRNLPNYGFNGDDYLNQTYWMSTSLQYLTSNKFDKIPDWLNLAYGWGIEADSWNINPADPGTGGKYEAYLSLDINLMKLLKPKKKFWYQVVKHLNYLKVPMPTLQISPKPKLWGLYF